MVIGFSHLPVHELARVMERQNTCIVKDKSGKPCPKVMNDRESRNTPYCGAGSRLPGVLGLALSLGVLGGVETAPVKYSLV
jgi:hypothetical protein